MALGILIGGIVGIAGVCLGWWLASSAPVIEASLPKPVKLAEKVLDDYDEGGLIPEKQQ